LSKRALVEGEKEEFESGKPNKEEGGGATKVEGREVEGKDEEKVENWKEGEKPQEPFWYFRGYVITIA